MLPEKVLEFGFVVLPGFTGFYRVLPGFSAAWRGFGVWFDGFAGFLPSFAKFHWVVVHFGLKTSFFFNALAVLQRFLVGLAEVST